MKKLYVPWRSSYAKSVSSTVEKIGSAIECVFCQQFAQTTDDAHFILHRFTHITAMLNRYPYNAGHILLLPHAHIARLDQLSVEAQHELIALTSHTVTILETVLGSHGTNVGINLGKAAGAGIPSHLHVHVLPRWMGDTNFLPALADTKTISFDLKKIYEDLKPHFENISF